MDGIATDIENNEIRGLEFLASKSTNKNRLVTIVNWELYQSEEDESASKVASNRQAAKQKSAEQITTRSELAKA